MSEQPSLEEVVSEYKATQPPPEPPPEEAPPEPKAEAKESTQLEEPAEPITADSVRSDKAPDDSLPDSSLIAERIERIQSNTASQQDIADDRHDMKKLMRDIQALRQLRGEQFDDRYEDAVEQVEAREGDQSQLMQAFRKELDELKQANEQIRQQHEQAIFDRDMREAHQEVVSWVKANEKHFPLLNAVGEQGLVFQKMWNHKQKEGQWMSEAKAAREVESDILAIVERCAPVLGYTKSQNKEPRREEQVSVGADGLHTAEPIDLSNMTDDEALNALVRQYEKTQR